MPLFRRPDGKRLRKALRVRWTFDERIHVAFHAARSIALVQRIVESPERHAAALPASPPVPGAAAS